MLSNAKDQRLVYWFKSSWNSSGLMFSKRGSGGLKFTGGGPSPPIKPGDEGFNMASAIGTAGVGP
jgi:hypothetical protein